MRLIQTFKFFAAALIFLGVAFAQPAPAQFAVTSTVDITKAKGNETDPAITINPYNSSNLFVASVSSLTNGILVAYSSNVTAWTTNLVAFATDTNLIPAFGEPTVAWDANSNLFLAYEPATFQGIAVAVSTNGGQTFVPFALLAANDVTDQPRIVAGVAGAATNSVWIVYKDYSLPGTPLVAQGLVTTNIGTNGLSAFSAAEPVPNSGAGGFPDIAVGPSNNVMVVYQNNTFSSSPASIFASVNTNTLLTNGFGLPVTVANNAVGGFTYIPAETNGNGINASVGVAWDENPTSLFYNRAYVVYNSGIQPAIDISLSASTNGGASWQAIGAVNDDAGTGASHFFPRVALDQVTGSLGVCWLDCRNDTGAGKSPGIPIPGDTNSFTNIFDLDRKPNNDFMVYATISTNGGASFNTNLPMYDTNVTASSLPGGTATFVSSAYLATNANGLGSHIGLAYAAGNFFPVWPDNSPFAVGNPDASAFDLMTAFTVLPTANLVVTITESPNPPTSDQTITYSVVVSNTGPSVAKSLSVTNVLATTVTLVGVHPAAGGSFILSNTNQTIVFNFSSLASGKSLTNLIIVTATQSGYATNLASAGSSIADPSVLNNVVTNIVLINAEDLTLNMTSTPTNVDIGSAVSYTLTVTNLGPATNGLVFITNTFPGNLSQVTNVSQSQGNYTVTNNLIIFSLGTIGSNQSATVSFDATALSLGTNFQFATNTAFVTSTDFDTNYANNYATNITTILGEDLAVGLTSSATNVNAGDVITYVLNITNLGPSSSGNVTLSGAFSDNLGQITMIQLPPNASGGTIGQNGFNFNIGQIAANQVVTTIYTAVALSVNATDTNATNTISVISTDFDTNLVNNTASATATINGEDIAIGLVGSPSVLPLGQAVTYTETVTNLGSSGAGLIKVTNTLSANLGSPTVLQSPGTYSISGRKIIFQIGTVPAGQTATIAFSTIPTAIGTATNSVGMGSSVFDTNLLNNTNFVLTSVVVPTSLVSNFTVTAGPSSAFFVWDTPFPTAAQIAYGVTTNYGSMTSLTPLATHHVVLIPGLARNTNYYYSALTSGEGVSATNTGTFATVDTIILNTIDASYNGSWSQGSPAITGFYGSYFNVANTTQFNPTAAATYSPNIPNPGRYDVSVWYPQNAILSTNTQMYVSGATNTLIKSVNQTTNGGKWLNLASNVFYASGTGGNVIIYNDTGETNKLVAANAMQFNYAIGQDFPTNGVPPAWWTSFYFGTNIAAGIGNYPAYVFGIDPTNPTNGFNFWLALQTNNTATVTFTPYVGGRFYQLQSSTNLAKGWLTLTNQVGVDTNATGIFTNGSGNGVFTLTQTNASSFYRISAQLLPQ